MSRRSPQDFRKRMSNAALELANMIRRVVFAGTVGGQWGIAGYETAAGIEGEDDEPLDTYPGLHIYARPGDDDNAEGLMFSVGAQSNHAVIGAFRNEDARRRYVEEHGELAPGELAIFNAAGTSRVFISSAGEISIDVESGQEVFVRTPGGTTDALVTKGEFERHTHATAALGVPSPPIQVSGAPLTYTSVLKAE